MISTTTSSINKYCKHEKLSYRSEVYHGLVMELYTICRGRELEIGVMDWLVVPCPVLHYQLKKE